MPPNKPPAASAYCGLYTCHTDNCLYRVAHTDSKHTDLLMQRRTPTEPEWRAPYTVEEKHLKRLLDFGSFTRLPTEPTT